MIIATMFPILMLEWRSNPIRCFWCAIVVLYQYIDTFSEVSALMKFHSALRTRSLEVTPLCIGTRPNWNPR